MLSPIPRLPPVTRTLRMMARHFACRGDSQLGNDVNGCWNFMPGKRISANLQDLPLQFGCLGSRVSLDHYVSDDQGTGNGALSRPHKRHPNLWMPVDYSFYFLRVNFQAANVNHSIPAPNEIVAISAAFENIGRVNEAICIPQSLGARTDITDRHPIRAHPQGSVFDLDLHIANGLPNEGRGKTSEAVVHFEH